MEIWMDDVKTLALVDVDGMDLYQLNVFPNGPLDKAVANGSVPPCATIAEKADMYACENLKGDELAYFYKTTD